MTHRLQQRHHLNGVGHNPMVATLRYRCECAENEVLSIATVLSADMTEEAFVWTMRQMWRDVKYEVEQHLNRPNAVNAHVEEPGSVTKDAWDKIVSEVMAEENR